MVKNYKIIGMIPARLGSQRLKRKNLRNINGVPLITHAITRAKQVDCIDEIWVNSESDELGKVATKESVSFYKRPANLADNNATSEDFVYDFLKKHECDYLFQIHTIAPLLFPNIIEEFIHSMIDGKYDTMLSVVNEQIECAYNNVPINFNFSSKINSQELRPVQRITWSITGWKNDNYTSAYESKKCATYSGNVGFYPISREAGHIIKTEEDLSIAEALLPLIEI